MWGSSSHVIVLVHCICLFFSPFPVVKEVLPFQLSEIFFDFSYPNIICSSFLWSAKFIFFGSKKHINMNCVRFSCYFLHVSVFFSLMSRHISVKSCNALSSLTLLLFNKSENKNWISWTDCFLDLTKTPFHVENLVFIYVIFIFGN